jgi:hypothetical protein
MTGNTYVGAPNAISGPEGSLAQSCRELITALQWKTIRQGLRMGFSLFYQEAIYFPFPLDPFAMNGDNYEDEACLSESQASLPATDFLVERNGLKL